MSGEKVGSLLREYFREWPVKPTYHLRGDSSGNTPLKGRAIKMMNIYLIKDLAQVTGYSVDTIKYYLKIGLIKEIGRGPETNFRFFDDSTAERLRLIRELRLKGHSIGQIKQNLAKLRKGEDELL